MGKGGSRWSAGRPGWRPKAEQCCRVDVRWMRQTGRLSGAGSLVYKIGDERVGSIGYINAPDELILSYTLNGEPRRQYVPKLLTRCHYGGWRTWLGCSRCGRRCAVLYLRGQGFYCRLCAKVAYLSQSDDFTARQHRAMAKLESRLDEDGGKPKRMHWRTFDRICDKLGRRDLALGASLMRFLARHGYADADELLKELGG